MRNNNNQWNASQPIDQLWYMWSPIGLSSNTAGFRIRAASGSLTEVDSLQVQDLDKYLRYNLPEGSGRIDPSRAPLSLSFFQTANGRRILLNKTYTGRDGVGRPGAFFAHLLADLPTDFTVRDAILLWRSPFWQSSDASIGNSLHLQSTSVEELRRYQLRVTELNALNPIGIDYAQTRTFLPVFIRSYLMWRAEWERRDQVPGQEPKHLYIAAPADLVAAFLLTLTICLPDALLDGLTFSTYEKEVQVQGLTMPLLTATAFSQETINARKDLPLSCYQGHIALNCYTGKSNLDDYPLVPLATAVSEDIAQRLEKPQSAIKKFETFKKRLARYPRVDMEAFLNAYDQFFLREHEQPSKEGFVDALQNPHFAADYLGNEIWQEFGLQLALNDPLWGQNDLPKYLEALCQYEHLDVESRRELNEALTQFAICAAQRAADAIQNWGERAAFAMYRIMLATAPKDAPNYGKVWNTTLSLLEQGYTEIVCLFFEKYRGIYLDFLEHWAVTLPKNKYSLIESFLLIPWESKEEDDSTKKKFLAILLSSPVSAGREEQIITTASPSSATLVWLLQQYGPSYLQQESKEMLILEHFASLSNRTDDKMKVLCSWLQPVSGPQRPPEFVAWLEEPKSWTRLEKVLDYASLKSNESAWFLGHLAEYYLRRYEPGYILSFPETNMARYIRDYLDYLKKVSPDILLQPPSATSAFLRFLSKDYFQYLPEDIYQKVSEFSGVSNILSQSGTCKDMVIAFAKQVHHVSPVIRERFTEQLAERITNEAEFAILFGIMMTFTQLFTPSNLMQILYGMAEIVRDTAAQSQSKWDRRLIPYVNFALHSESFFSEEFFSGELPQVYPRFMYNFLDALLGGADEDMLEHIERNNESSWDERTTAEWQGYLSRKKGLFLSTTMTSPTSSAGVHTSSSTSQAQAAYFDSSTTSVGKRQAGGERNWSVNLLKRLPGVGDLLSSDTGRLPRLPRKPPKKSSGQVRKI